MSDWHEKNIGTKLGCLATAVLIGLPLSCELLHDFASARVKAQQTHWREAIQPYLKPGEENLACPNAKVGDGYAMEPL